MKEKYKKRLEEYRYFAHRMRKSPIYFNRNLSMFGDSLVEDRDGQSAEYCMWKYESTGKMPPCKEIDGFRYLLMGKGARDWHVSEWGKGMAEGVTTWSELLQDSVPKSLVEAAVKARDGFTRRRLREQATCRS